MGNDNCGWPTADDTACQNPATGDDGRCWIATHGDPEAIPNGGRPSKFNEERQEAILEAARIGITKEGCARAAGIHKSTLYDWLDKYPDFSDAFKRARAQGEDELVEATRKRRPEWLLERSYGYTKKTEHEVSGEGGPLVIMPEDAAE